MFHKGLDRERIVQAAKELIEQCGYDGFSMRLLAENLGVKTASLYAHVESMEALLTDVGLMALREQREYQMKAIDTKHRDEAVRSFAQAYRSYAKEHSEFYHFIMKMPISKDDALKQAAEMTAGTAMQAIAEYSLTNERKMHWQRVLRGVMHGFVSQEENGYFSHYPVDVEESYHIAIQCLINGLHLEEAQSNEQG